MRFCLILTVGIMLCPSLSVGAGSPQCVDIFTLSQSINSRYLSLEISEQSKLPEVTREIRLLTEESFRPVLREMTRELLQFRAEIRESDLEVVNASELRPRESTFQKHSLKPLEVFDGVFPESIVIRFGRDDIMIEAGVTPQNKSLISSTALTFAAFGRYLFFERPDLIARWEAQLKTSLAVKNNTFSEGDLARVFEDVANSTLVSLSLLSSNWTTLGLSKAEFLSSIVNTSSGATLFDVLAARFAPGYIGPFASFLYVKNPVELNSENSVVLTTDMKNRIQLSRLHWQNRQHLLPVTTVADVKETGRGCPMARCLAPQQPTDLSAFIIGILNRSE